MICRRFISCYRNTSQMKTIWRSFFDNNSRLSSVNISYTIYPEGKMLNKDHLQTPIFVLHGLFGSKSNWHSLAKRIASMTKRQVVTLDARNHGESGHAPKINYLLMRDDLLRTMDMLHVEKPILIGHSMGGKTVMCLALSNPERVDSMIVVDTAPSTSPGANALKMYSQTMKAVQLSSFSSLTEARNQVGNALKTVVSEAAVLQFLLTNLKQAENKAITWRVNLDAIIHGLGDICSFPKFSSTYDGNVLFIGGSESTHIDESVKAVIRQHFPKATIEYISNAGHWVHADKPEDFLQKVKEFIQKTHSEI